MIVPGMFVCSSFLISVCMFIVSKALLISSATVIGRAGGASWLTIYELSQGYGKPCANCVYPPAPSIGGPITVVWASQSCGYAGWLVLIIIKVRVYPSVYPILLQ